MLRHLALLVLLLFATSGCDVVTDDDPLDSNAATTEEAQVSSLVFGTRDNDYRAITLLNSWLTSANNDGDRFPVHAMVTLTGDNADVSLWTSQRHLVLLDSREVLVIPSVHDSQSWSLLMMSARKDHPIKLEMDIDIFDPDRSYSFTVGDGLMNAEVSPSAVSAVEFWRVFEKQGNEWRPHAQDAYELERMDGEYFRLVYDMSGTLVLEIPLRAEMKLTDLSAGGRTRVLSIETARLQLMLTPEP